MIRRTLTLSALAFVALAATAAAQQAPVDCSRLTVQQARGLVCLPDHPPIGAPPAQRPATGLPLLPDNIEPTEADCAKPLDAYTESARAARCTLWELRNKPRPPLPVYEVGAVYAHPYAAIRMIVLSISTSIEGVPVVTAQYVAGDAVEVGSVFAFRIDRGVPWWKVEP